MVRDRRKGINNKKRFIKMTIKFLILIIIILTLSTNLLNFATSEKKIAKAFENIKYKPDYHFFSYEKRKLHYVTIGNNKNPLLLLLHGSPGSWDAWKEFITKTSVLENYFVIAVDRPGYNKTTLKKGYSLQDQSAFLAPIIKKYCNRCIVLGHSYGGALALQVGIDNQSKIKGVVSVAGTVAFPYQKRRWYNYVLNFWPLKFLVSKMLLSSNKEMWQLADNLKEQEPYLSEFSKKVVLIQGGKDLIVNSKSLEYINEKLENASVKTYFKENGNHLLIWNDLEGIIDALGWIEKE